MMAVDSIARAMAMDAAKQGGTGDAYTRSEADAKFATKAVATDTTDGLMSSADKNKLDGIESDQSVVIIEPALNPTSENAVQNKTLYDKFLTIDANIAAIRVMMNAVLYGYRVNKNDSNPETRVEYMYDAVGMTPARMNYTTGVFDYGSWANAWFITGNKPVALKFDGTVDYELDPDDYTKKADGTDSDLFVALLEQPEDWATAYTDYFQKEDGAFVPVSGESAPGFQPNTYYSNSAYDGNFMASIPTVWVKRWEDENYCYVALSDKQVTPDFKAYAHDAGDGYINDYFYAPMFKGVAIDGKLRSIAGYNMLTKASCYNAAHNTVVTMEPGWQLWDFEKYNVMVYLLTLIGRTTDTASCYGRGFVKWGAWSDNPLRTFTSGSGRFYGIISDAAHAMKVFHIEHLWCIRVDAMEGAFKSNGRLLYKHTRPYDYTTGLTDAGIDIPADGYIIDENVGDFGIFPKSTGGSNTTYYCGYFRTGSNPYCPVHIGTDEGSGNASGIYSLSCWQTSGFSRFYIGGSPCYNAIHESE